MRARTAVAASSALALGLAFPLTSAGSAHAAGGEATLAVLHAAKVAGAETVDIYANGQPLVAGLAYGDGKLLGKVPAGTYDLTVFAAGADPATATPLIVKSTSLAAGSNVTVVAQTNAAGGNPALVPFVNYLAPTPAGKARVTVRHVAAAPAVDVLADGKVIMPDLQNTQVGAAFPQQQSIFVPAGPVALSVNLAGTSTAVVPAAGEDTLEAGITYVLYAVGDGRGVTIIPQVYPVGVQAAPTTPPTTAPPATRPAPPATNPPVTVIVRPTGTLPSSVAAGDGGTAPTGDPVLPIIAIGLLGAGAAAVGTRQLVKK